MSITIGNQTYNLHDYNASEQGTLLAIEMDINNQRTWLFYHPGAHNSALIKPAAMLVYHVGRALTQRNAIGIALSTYFAGRDVDSFISTYNSINANDEGYYDNFNPNPEVIISGKLTTNNLS